MTASRPLLLDALDAQTPAVQAAAARALGELGRTEALGRARELLETRDVGRDDLRAMRRTVVYAYANLCALGDEGAFPERMSLLSAFLCDEEEQAPVRCSAAIGLGQLALRGTDPTEAAIAGLVRGACGRDDKVGEACLRVLFAIGNAVAVRLTTGLRSVSKTRLGLACYVACELLTPTAIEVLDRLLDSGHLDSSTLSDKTLIVQATKLEAQGRCDEGTKLLRSRPQLRGTAEYYGNLAIDY